MNGEVSKGYKAIEGMFSILEEILTNTKNMSVLESMLKVSDYIEEYGSCILPSVSNGVVTLMLMPAISNYFIIKGEAPSAVWQVVNFALEYEELFRLFKSSKEYDVVMSVDDSRLMSKAIHACVYRRLEDLKMELS